MRKSPYSLTSVDNALQLALWLRSRDSMRLSDAATELGVAQSTAHRLLTTLCYRGFAAQLPDKSYVVGPVLQSAGPLKPTSRHLLEAVEPRLQSLRDAVEETAQFAVLTGREITFLAAAEGLAHTLSVQAQTGKRMPAHLTAAGRALLAAHGEEEVVRLYGQGSHAGPGTPDANLPDLLRRLRVVRERGYATNSGEVDRGINAIGISVRSTSGQPVGAITISAPAHRLPSSRNQFITDAIRAEVEEVERRLTSVLD